ncbi:DNA topoisomerase 3 [Pseudomonas sp. PSPC3-3]|uniref:type IA DNA topoisomerase n=1 Tax=unclassified Pseudomonas TaxID=196821 RepID=UPI003CFAB917
MRVFIAEKPALAKVIAEALGNPRSKGGYIECGQDIVTWCVGHLLALAPPDAHNPAYAKWNAEDLPLKLRPEKYVPIPATADQLKTVGEWIGKASEIVHAGDPDDEGQLLVDEVLLYFSNKSPVKRLLISDMNANAARKALGNIRDNSEFYGLSQKALARSIGDQLYGFNMTRAYTLAAQAKGIKAVLSVGRVQTVVLGLIVNRYLANRSHSAAYFYSLSANLAFGENTLGARFVVPPAAPVDEKNRIVDEAYANEVARACRQSPATVVSVSVPEKTTQAPLPFALLDLQVHISKEHGLDAEKTLAITQALREKYKAITYNRSDCSYLTDEQFAEAPETLDALAQALPELKSAFANVDSERKSRAFNDSKVSAHTAIIPTAAKFEITQLTADEQKVYMAIVKRYLAQFLPEKRYLAAEVCFDVTGNAFIAKANKTTVAGWTSLVSADIEEEEGGDDDGDQVESRFDVLSVLTPGATGLCADVKIAKEKTKPLPIYTEAMLLKDLQRVSKYVQDPRIKQLLLERDQGKAAGENGGIGTPATRGSMLAKLRDRNFYTVDKKKLIPTPLGLEFVAALPAIATTPDMTALWHEQQQRIESGEMSVDAFLDELELFIADQVRNVDVGNIKIQTQAPAFQITANCPMCGGELAVTPKVIGCKACSFKIWPEISGKTLTSGQLEALLTKGKTAMLKGFKSQAGKAFDASLRLDAQGKVQMVFAR